MRKVSVLCLCVKSIPDVIEDSAGRGSFTDPSDSAELQVKNRKKVKNKPVFPGTFKRPYRRFVSFQRKVKTACIKIKRKHFASERCGNKS